MTDKNTMPRCDIEELKLKIMGLESEIDMILDVLLKASPKHEGWIKKNFPKFMEKRNESINRYVN